MAEYVWVWHQLQEDRQHLTPPPDDVTLSWEGETVCELTGDLRRVSWENVDVGKACPVCTTEPFNLAGDDRGPP